MILEGFAAWTFEQWLAGALSRYGANVERVPSDCTFPPMFVQCMIDLGGVGDGSTLLLQASIVGRSVARLG